MALISSNGTGGGNWSVAATWAGGVVPAEGDCATIVVGDIVTIDDAAPGNVIIGDDHVGVAYAITINGKLQYLSTAAIDHVFRCKGDLVNAAGGAIEIGTVANPIPAARTFTIELNYSGVLADGKYGLKNSGDMVLQGDPTRITVTKCMLNADAAVNDNALTTDVATGWKDNDDIAIASTTRTWSQAENGKMNGDAVGNALTIDGFGGVGGGLANAHSGTSPTQAEIINLTRNVKVTSFNTGFRGYVCCYSGSTSDVDYVEFYMIGYNTTYKHGIEIRTTAADATNFAYCSVWGKATSNYSFYLYYAQNVVIDNCVIYDIDEEFYLDYGSTNTITNSILMKINDYGFYAYQETDLTFDNNVITSCYGWSVFIRFKTPASFNNNLIHSGKTYGLYWQAIPSGVIQNLTIYRQNGVGFYLYESLNLEVDTLTLFGNTLYNLYLSGSGSVDMDNAELSGDSSFATPYGAYLVRNTAGTVVFKNSDFGLTSGIKVSHTTGDIAFATNKYGEIVCINTKLQSTTPIYAIQNSAFGSYVQCEDLNQTQYNDKAWYKYGIVVRDSTTFKTGSYAMRFDQFWAADDWLDYEVEIPVKDGEGVVVSAWLRKNASYTSANRPKIKLSEMGITATEDQMSNVTDTWEKVTVSGTPTRTGMAKLNIMTYLTNAGASAWCDFEKTGLTMPVLNTLEGSFWTDGHIAQILFDTGSITAKEFWETLLVDVDKTGSFANLIEDYLDAQLSLIKAQTDKMNFTGTDIKATLDGEKVVLTDATETQIDDIETDLNTPDQYKADVSALALEATLTVIKGATFVEATDSLEAIRNRGDISWLTATGFSTHTAAAIWIAANRTLSTPADYKADISALALEDSGRVQNIESDTNEMQGKLPNDKIAGSSDKTSLENKHGTDSWEGTTPTDVADAVDTKLSAEHGTGSWMGKVSKIFVPLIKRLK